jgi:hypothetical protein
MSVASNGAVTDPLVQKVLWAVFFPLYCWRFEEATESACVEPDAPITRKMASLLCGIDIEVFT